MFKFLKDKLSSAVSKFSKDVTEEVGATEEEQVKEEQQPEEKPDDNQKGNQDTGEEPEKVPEVASEPVEEPEAEVKEPEEPREKEDTLQNSDKTESTNEKSEDAVEEPKEAEETTEAVVEEKEEPEKTKDTSEKETEEDHISEPKPEVKKPEEEKPVEESEEAELKDGFEDEANQETEEQEEHPKESFFSRFKKGIFKKRDEDSDKEESDPEKSEDQADESAAVESDAKKSEVETDQKEESDEKETEEVKPADETKQESVETEFADTTTEPAIIEKDEKSEEEPETESPGEESEKKPEEDTGDTTPEPEVTKEKTEQPVDEKTEKEELEDISKYSSDEDKGFFSKIGDRLTKRKVSMEKFEELFFEIELVMLENNVAVEVIEKIKQDLIEAIVDKELPRNKIQKIILDTLKKSVSELFDFQDQKIDILQRIKEKDKKPYKIIFVGINGSGKTTTIAKMAKFLKDNDLTCVVSASDTFRAASIEQLQKHADNVGVKLIKHDYGSDAAAVAFDAIKYAESKNIDVVLIDTAGRLHSNVNLMDELKKVHRVTQPDLKIFVGESITGNDCVEQSARFNEAVDIDGIILSKADIDEKGGAALSVSYVTKKPILFIGTGQEYSDIEPFDKEKMMNNLGLV